MNADLGTTAPMFVLKPRLDSSVNVFILWKSVSERKPLCHVSGVDVMWRPAILTGKCGGGGAQLAH